jgi:hypothetical protein
MHRLMQRLGCPVSKKVAPRSTPPWVCPAATCARPAWPRLVPSPRQPVKTHPSKEKELACQAQIGPAWPRSNLRRRLAIRRPAPTFAPSATPRPRRHRREDRQARSRRQPPLPRRALRARTEEAPEPLSPPPTKRPPPPLPHAASRHASSAYRRSPANLCRVFPSSHEDHHKSHHPTHPTWLQ